MTGTELRDWRERRGWTIQMLADELDVSARTVTRWEKLDTLARRDEYAVRWLQHLIEKGFDPSIVLG